MDEGGHTPESANAKVEADAHASIIHQIRRSPDRPAASPGAGLADSFQMARPEIELRDSLVNLQSTHSISPLW